MQISPPFPYACKPCSDITRRNCIAPQLPIDRSYTLVVFCLFSLRSLFAFLEIHVKEPVCMFGSVGIEFLM